MPTTINRPLRVSYVGLCRLAILAAHLRKVPREKFDISTWVNSSLIVSINDCGMTACAGGHACFIPTFKRAGLRYSGGTPRFGGDFGFHALRNFFQIDLATSIRFFNPDCYPRGKRTTAKEVARRIENFIRKESRK